MPLGNAKCSVTDTLGFEVYEKYHSRATTAVAEQYWGRAVQRGMGRVSLKFEREESGGKVW